MNDSSPVRRGCARQSASHKCEVICQSTHWPPTPDSSARRAQRATYPLGWRRISSRTTKVTIFSRQAANQCPFSTSTPFFSCFVTVNRAILTRGIYFAREGPDLHSPGLHLPNTGGTQTLGHAFLISHPPSPWWCHRSLIRCITYEWVYSSTSTDQATLHIWQELKSSLPSKHKVYWGQHVRIPALDATSRWSRTDASAEDGKSHRK